MLEKVDLSLAIEKDEYKATMDEMEVTLPALQRRARELDLPVLLVFEGWDAAGKGTCINNLIQPLDPRGFIVHTIQEPNEEERLRPFLWRFWTRTPARGRIAIFDHSWYRRVLDGRVNGRLDQAERQQAFTDINSFERQLADDGTVIVKFFLHISKEVQAKRFKKLRKRKSTAWRVQEDDLDRHENYDEYLTATEEMLARTDTDYAPWTVVEAHDRRHATAKIIGTVLNALEMAVADRERRQQADAARPARPAPARATQTVLDQVDLTLELERDEYRKRLKKAQIRLRDLEHEIYRARIPAVLVYEGWDAAGKGGNIRRLTRRLDPRGYEVVPIAAPNDVEKAHHYLWRFWNAMPKGGHITIFDRSWYGRVLVERVEGFCSPAAWRRAYREINEMEQHMVNFGAVVCKFWLEISQEEQLARFESRQQDEYKQWKITDEDWRNREKWDAYKAAVDEMLFRTSTTYAPWTIVESNCKWYARVKAIETVCEALETKLDDCQ